MKKTIFADSSFEIATKKTRNRTFLEEMNSAVSSTLPAGITQCSTRLAKSGRTPFHLETMPRIHFLQFWNNYSDPALEDALHDMTVFRCFVGADSGTSRSPNESTISQFWHFLEEFGLAKVILGEVRVTLQYMGLLRKNGAAVNEALISAPHSTKNDGNSRDQEMLKQRKGIQYHLRMKAHIGVDAGSGLAYNPVKTAAHKHGVTQAQDLPHYEETDVFADSSSRDLDKRKPASDLQVKWHIAMMSVKHPALNLETVSRQLRSVAERVEAGIRAKVKHSFPVIKCQFGFTMFLYRGLAKNTARLHTLFALSNLWIVRRHILREVTG
jgi:IS5 family transposase